MSANGFPAFDLPLVFCAKSSAHVVAAIPLEPSARIMCFIDPSLIPPNFQRLTGMLVKKVYGVIVLFGRKFGTREPAFWKFIFAVGHVLAAKDAKREHVFWRKVWRKVRVKISSCGFGAGVRVAALKCVVNNDGFLFHTLRFNIQNSQCVNCAPYSSSGCHDRISTPINFSGPMPFGRLYTN